MKKDAKKYFKEFFKGTKTMFKEFFNKETNKKQRANMFTFGRLISPVIALITSIIAMLTGMLPLFITSGIIAGLGAITDYFDGKSSRKHNSSSEYGKTLDAVSDKVFAGIIGINLLFINLNYIIILLGEALISGINIYYKEKYKDIDIKSSRVGKIKEWPLFFTLAIGYFSPISNLFANIANLFIVLTFVIQLIAAEGYLKNNIEEVKDLKNDNSIDNIDNNEEEISKTKSNELIKENKNSNNIVINSTKLNDIEKRKEEYNKLRNVLNDVKKNNVVNEEQQTNKYQKILKK